MRQPLIYGPLELRQWPVDEEYAPGFWRPSRPCAFDGEWAWERALVRLKIAWDVFTGKYDALNWNLPNEKTTIALTTMKQFD